MQLAATCKLLPKSKVVLIVSFDMWSKNRTWQSDFTCRMLVEDSLHDYVQDDRRRPSAILPSAPVLIHDLRGFSETLRAL